MIMICQDSRLRNSTLNKKNQDSCIETMDEIENIP